MGDFVAAIAGSNMEFVSDKLGFKKSSPQRHREHREGIFRLRKNSVGDSDYV
ncbi:hypothetical protein CKA32_006535 [Geitlerinema sp. FC II]|nr:hypothetical protein CKA32_006535 [Geitlerinema sp. FC II]